MRPTKKQSFVLALLVGASLPIAPNTLATDWPQFGMNNAHTGYNEAETILTRSAIKHKGLVEKWHYTTGGPLFSSPAVVSGIVYIGSDDGSVYALDAGTGKKKWSCALGGAVKSTPCVSGGKVFIGSNNGTFYALDAATGTNVWTFSAGGPAFQASPCVFDGKVYIGCDDGFLYVKKSETGNLLWKFATGGAVTSPAIGASGRIYISSADSKVYALNQNGETAWQFKTLGPIYASPTVADGVLLIGSGLADPTGRLHINGKHFVSPPQYPSGLKAGGIEGKSIILSAPNQAAQMPPVSGLEATDSQIFSHITVILTGPASTSAVTHGELRLYDITQKTEVNANPLERPAGKTMVQIKTKMQFHRPEKGHLYAIYVVQTASGVQTEIKSMTLQTASGLHYGLDADTGAVKWNCASGGTVYGTASVGPGDAGGKMTYYGTHAGSIWARYLQTGERVSSWTCGTRAVYSLPAVTPQIVVHGSIFRCDPPPPIGHGTDKWADVKHVPFPIAHLWVRRSTKAADATALSVLAQVLRNNGGTKDPPMPGVRSSPAVVNGMIYVGADDSNVYAFGLAR